MESDYERIVQVHKELSPRQKVAQIIPSFKQTIETSAVITSFSALIALTGLLNWCSRCGEWQGPGSEGSGNAVPKPASPPARLVKALSTPLSGSATPIGEVPKNIGNKLTSLSGRLERVFLKNDTPAKERYSPPSKTHGRKVETFTGGSLKPDGPGHGHQVTYIRGDGVGVELYDRANGFGLSHNDTSIYVSYDESTNTYEWSMPDE